jgi:hypothetical protein
MNDLLLIIELVNSPTSLADEFGLPFPPTATDDDPGDADEFALVGQLPGKHTTVRYTGSSSTPCSSRA